MRRLLLLLLGLGIAVYGFDLIAGADSLYPYLLRDGLLVALVGGLLFAVNAGSLSGWGAAGRSRPWTARGGLLLATGVACGVAAAAVFLLLGSQGWPAWLGGSLWGLAMVLWVASLLVPRSADYGLPAYRWSRDAAGRFVRLARGSDTPADGELSPSPALRWGGVAALLVIAGGWALRLWRLGEWPSTCIDLECVQALRLVDGSWWTGVNPDSTGFHALLAAALWRVTGDGVAALRWASALLGCATLPLFYWAARGVTRPAGALLGTALLAFSPWHIWASRGAGPWIVVPLLLALTLGAAARGTQRPNPRWWGLAGGTLGLLLAQPVLLRETTVAWALLLAALAWWVAERRRNPDLASGQGPVLLLGSLLAVGLPVALPAWLAAPAGAPGRDLLGWLTGLLHGGGAPIPFFTDHPLLSPLAAALALCGVAVLVGSWRRPAAVAAASGALFYGVGVARFAGGEPAPAVGLLVWLPFFYLAAAVALDQILVVFDRTWARLVPLARAAGVALALLLLVAGRNALELTTDLRTASGDGQDAAEVAIGRYLAACLAGALPADPCSVQGETAPVFYVPPAVVEHPATRLLLGPALDRGRVRALDVVRDLPPTVLPEGDLMLLVPLDNQPLVDLVQQVYPNARYTTPPRDEPGPTLFLVYTIPYTEVLAHRGLFGRYTAGLEENGDGELRQDGPLAFAWQNSPPLAAPFHVVWEGSLLVPEAGTYLFQVEGIGPGAADPVVSMQLDGRLVLDTSLGLMEQHTTLAQGSYRLSLRYRAAGPPGDWAIRWQPPGGNAEPIPRVALYSPPLPHIGLLGTYYTGRQWQGPALTVRKDLILGADVDLPAPYSVHWQGKLAVPRAGETLFAVTADGPVQLQIDGLPVLDHLPAEDVSEGPGFSQASVYLDVGWHDVDVRYAPPTAEPDLRLLWQPPGSSPMLLLSRYLLPLTAEVTPGDVPLPPAPELIDSRLGSGLFALSASMDLYQPVRALPPRALPSLLAEQVWQAGNGCGAGEGQFDQPHGLALDANAGTLYVADTANRRIVELDMASGGTTYLFTGEALQEPVDVELTPDGKLLALDALAQSIFRIDRATGELAPLALETGFYRPRGFGIDSLGNLAVADTGGARVVLLDSSGAVLGQYGGPQSLVGQGQPVDTLAAGDSLWTITAENGRLWRLDVLGSLVAIERSNTLDGPHLAGLPDGSFFLSDPVGRTVLYFAATGQPLAELAYSQLFVVPTGVAAGLQAGQVYLAVSDTAACTVSLWRMRLAS